MVIKSMVEHIETPTKMYTPQKFNMEPENQWLEDVFPTEIITFLGSMLIFRGVFMGIDFVQEAFHPKGFSRPFAL